MHYLNDQIASLQGPIVVFGAGGFVGTNCLRRILSVRADCYGITHQNFIPWRLVGLPPEKILKCDVTLANEVEDLFFRHRFKTILYFAAYGGYSRQDNTAEIYRTNLMGLVNVVETAAEYGISSMVHAGSSSEYGSNCSGPIESGELRPNSHYAVSKVSASYFVHYSAVYQKLPLIHLRFYSLYGPWEESDRLIPKLIKHGLLGEYPPMVEPDISRDFVYVGDAIDSVILAATKGTRDFSGASINIASGKKITMREIAGLAKELFQLRSGPVWGTMENRKWDLKEWYGDPTLAEVKLGWKARTTLKEGLALTVEWTKAQTDFPQESSRFAVKKPVRISAIAACYRDAKAIPVMHERLTKVFEILRVDYEIIFVNDCSPDETDHVLAGICYRDRHVIAIEHSRNFGSQGAFLSGMEIATGDAVVLMDGDLQDPPELIADFYNKWIEGFDVVYGRRVRRETSAFMGICYKAFYRIFSKLAYVSIPLDAGDFSLIDRKVVAHLLSFPETDQFLRGLRAWVGFRQTGVDYERPERLFGTSTNSWHKNFWWARKALFSFSFAPLESLLYFGVGLTMLSFLLLIFQFIYRLSHPEIPHGITTIIILILFFGGIQILAISTLGEYLGKVLEESKRRPKFIRRSIRAAGTHLTQAMDIDKFVFDRGPSNV